MLRNSSTLVLAKGLTTPEPMNLVHHLMLLTSLQTTVPCIITSKGTVNVKVSEQTYRKMDAKKVPRSVKGHKML